MIDNREKWPTLIQLAKQSISEGNFTRAEANCLGALAIAETYPPDDYHLAITLELLSQIYFNLESYDHGAPVLTRFLEIYKRRLGEDHIDTATIGQNLAILYHCAGQLETACSYYEWAVNSKTKILGESDKETLSLRSSYEKLLSSMEHKDEDKVKRREMRRKGLTSTNQFDSISMDDITPSLN